MTEHAIVKSAEHRMRQWAIGLEINERIAREVAVKQLPEQVHPYIYISREAGAGAGTIARLVCEQLGWDVLGRELLDCMANQFHLEKGMVEFVDEKTTSWLLDVFGKWLDRQVVTESEYVTHLGQVVLMAARHASTVFVGRGAQFLLPRHRGLAVEIVAPLPQRIERIMRRDGLSRDDARRHLERTDRERREFVREHFHHDVSDPHLYDLVINLEHLAPEDAAELIVGHCERRFGVQRIQPK
jgi:cytidylate kinase